MAVFKCYKLFVKALHCNPPATVEAEQPEHVAVWNCENKFVYSIVNSHVTVLENISTFSQFYLFFSAFSTNQLAVTNKIKHNYNNEQQKT